VYLARSLILNSAVIGCLAEGLLEAKIESILATFEINAWGTLRMCQLALKMMIPNRFGRIVNVSAQRGEIGDDRTYE